MKKFISMVMAAAMVVSLVPATAFAASGAAVLKVTGVEEYTKDAAKKLNNLDENTQIQLVLKDVNGKVGTQDTFEFTLDFDGAEFVEEFAKGEAFPLAVARSAENSKGEMLQNVTAKVVKAVEEEDTSITLEVKEGFEMVEGEAVPVDFTVGDVIVMEPGEFLNFTKVAEGAKAEVSVYGDLGEMEAKTFAAILGEGLELNVAGKPVEVAEEEMAWTKEITLEPAVGTFTGEEVIKVKVSKGFEIVEFGTLDLDLVDVDIDEDAEYVELKVKEGTEELTFKLQIEAVTAKAGDEAVLKATCSGWDAAEDVAMIVVGEDVVMSVDEDEDVPVMYSGVDNNGVASYDDHKALEVTIEETVRGAWEDGKFSLTLPEGVYVVGAEDNGNMDLDWTKAYEAGEYEYFKFGRHAFDETDIDVRGDENEVKLTLELVADRDFTGDVVLTLEGDDVETQEVVIAKFVAPYTVDAKSNDLIIDYRNTEIPTDVVITEAEEGLFAEGDKLTFEVDRMQFEKDPTITTNEDDSDLEATVKVADKDSKMEIKIKNDSNDGAGVITISDMALYMGRSLAAGAYDLTVTDTLIEEMYALDLLGGKTTIGEEFEDAKDALAKEAFVNIITAGRDQDDASFTTKVVVPVGESYIVAGEAQINLDVPAYINAAGYTMLPVRAVSVALGIHTNNVLWDAATRTVTILYGQRIITMTVGQKVVNVNGSAIPATAAVEVVNGRAFLGMRDLATALGVTDITWDAATQTATLNGNK